MRKEWKNRTRKWFAFTLAVVMMLQQSSLATLAAELEPETTVSTETEPVTEGQAKLPDSAVKITSVPATEAETKATDAPETSAPATDAPETSAPETDAPETNAPATDAPETSAPATDAPVTTVPETTAPATEQAEQETTEAPATETEAPTTEPATEPAEQETTEAPATETEAPTTEPATEATEQETTEAPATEMVTEAPATEPATEQVTEPATQEQTTEALTETETEIETETETETEKKKESPTSLTATCNGVTVKVNAAKGVLAPGTELVVTTAGKRQALEAIQNSIDTETTTVDKSRFLAFDISLQADGKEVQPNGQVTVSFDGVSFASGLAGDEEIVVAHVNESAAMGISFFSASGQTAEISSGLSINTTHFSVYAVAVLKKVNEGTTNHDHDDLQPLEKSYQDIIDSEENNSSGYQFTYEENNEIKTFNTFAFDFHIFAHEAHLQGHTNGNVAAEVFSATGDGFGVNQNSEDGTVDYNYLGSVEGGIKGIVKGNITVLGSGVKVESTDNGNKVKIGEGGEQQEFSENIYQEQAGSDKFINIDKELEKLQEFSGVLAEEGLKGGRQRVTWGEDGKKTIGNPNVTVTRQGLADDPNLKREIIVTGNDEINYLNISARDLAAANGTTEYIIRGIQNKTLIINVDMTGVTTEELKTLLSQIEAKIEGFETGFDDKSGEQLARYNCNLLWNFYTKEEGKAATTYSDKVNELGISTEGRPFMGTVLAPGANVRYGAIDGSVIAWEANQNGKESHKWTFTGWKTAITVTKEVEGMTDKETFYFAVFDESGNRVAGPKALTFSEDGSDTLTFSGLSAGPGLTAYTVWETNESGEKLQSSMYKGYTITGNGQTVTLKRNSNSQWTGGAVTIKNEKPTSGSTTATFSGTKSISKQEGTEPKTQTFTFELYEVGSETAEPSGTPLDTTTTAGAGSFSFTQVYTEAGTYYYAVKEKAHNENGYTSDTTVHHFTVNVKKEGSSLVAEVSKEGTQLNFTNTYAAAKTSLTFGGTKKLEGIDATDTEFSFSMYEADKDFKITNQTPVKQDTRKGAGAIDFGSIEYENVGTYYYVVKEEALASAKGFTIDTTEYHVTVAVTDNKVGKLVAQTTVTGRAGATVTSLDFTNTYKAAKTNLTFSGTKKLEGIDATDTEFSFSMYKADKDFKITDQTPVKQATTNGAGTINFGSIEYTAADTYYYVVKEEALASANGFTIDATEYHVTVVVEDNKEGQLEVTQTTVAGRAGATVTTLDFTNTYKATDAKVTFSGQKSVEGITGTDKEFTFDLFETDSTFAVAADAQPLQSATTKGAGAINFAEITYSAAATHYYVVKERALTSADGFTTDTKVYQITVTVTDDGKGALTATVSGAEADQLNFTNTYKAEGKLSLDAKKSMKRPETALGTYEFEVKDQAGSVIATAANDATGAIHFENIVTYTEADAGKTFTYTVSEKEPADKTVIYDKTVYTVKVTVTDKGDGTLDVAAKIDGADAMTFVNDVTTARFSKVDAATGAELAGATLQIIDEAGNVVEQWVSDGSVHEVTAKLEAGKTYTMVETNAPNGYALAESITFTVSAEGTVEGTITMKDAHNSVSILKVDDKGEALAGAKLIVKDAKGAVIESWTTDGKAHVIDMIQNGTYTVSEVEAPEGYEISEDVAFEVTGKEKEPISVTMTDKTKPEDQQGRITVTKTVSSLLTDTVGRLESGTFYVALYSDAARTKRVSGVKAISFHGTHASSVTFDRLADGTYYVGETDENGTLIGDSGILNGKEFVPTYVDEVVTLDEDTQEGELTLDNMFAEFPDGFYIDGDLTITKEVLTADGTPVDSDATFYAAVFTDAALTQRYPDLPVQVLSMNGGSSTSVTVTPLTIGNTPDSTATYYVAETDENGTPLSQSGIEYEISIDGTKVNGKEVTLTGENPSQTVTITNTVIEEEESESEFESEEEETETETETETEAETTKQTEKKEAVRTGDDTNYMIYLFLLAISAGTCVAVFTKRRRKENK